MSFKYINQIPTAEDIIRDIPLPDSLKEIKSQRDKEIKEK